MINPNEFNSGDVYVPPNLEAMLNGTNPENNNQQENQTNSNDTSDPFESVYPKFNSTDEGQEIKYNFTSFCNDENNQNTIQNVYTNSILNGPLGQIYHKLDEVSKKAVKNLYFPKQTEVPQVLNIESSAASLEESAPSLEELNEPDPIEDFLLDFVIIDEEKAVIASNIDEEKVVLPVKKDEPKSIPTHIEPPKVTPILTESPKVAPKLTAKSNNIPYSSYIELAFPEVKNANNYEDLQKMLPKRALRDVLRHMRVISTIKGKAESIVEERFKYGIGLYSELEKIRKEFSIYPITEFSEELMKKAEEVLNLYYAYMTVFNRPNGNHMDEIIDNRKKFDAQYKSFINEFKNTSDFLQYVYEMAKAAGVTIEDWDNDFAGNNWHEPTMWQLSIQALERSLHGKQK